jgi:hypothetical protein
VFKYFLHPTLIDFSNNSRLDKLKQTLKIYLLYLASAFVIILILKLLDDLIINEFFQYSIMDQLYADNRTLGRNFGPYSFVIIVLIGQLIEEIIFRLPLRLERIGIALAVTVVCYRLSVDSFFIFEYWKWLAYGKIVFSILIFFSIIKFLAELWVEKIKKRYSVFFYIMAITFALVHLSNFTHFEDSVLGFYPLFILPQLLMGLCMGFVRVKYGFFYGLLLHSLINLPFALVNLSF